MRTIVALIMLGGLGASAPALAADQAPASGHAVQGRSISADEMKSKLDGLGYDVRQLRATDIAYEAKLIDRGSGSAVKATFNAADGELAGAKLAEAGVRSKSDQDDREAGDEKRGDRK